MRRVSMVVALAATLLGGTGPMPAGAAPAGATAQPVPAGATAQPVAVGTDHTVRPGWRLRWAPEARWDGLRAFEHVEDDRAGSID